jgi:protease I
LRGQRAENGYYLPEIAQAVFSRSGPILERGEQHSFSAPQANEPPESVMKVMKWSPRPSFRTAIALGALAILLISTKRKSA